MTRPTQHVKRPATTKNGVPRWKLKHENRKATKPVITRHASRLLAMLRGA